MSLTIEEKKQRKREAQARYVAKDPDKERARQRTKEAKRHRSLMREIHEHLGGACTQCQSTDRLEIDHILGDGRMHRIAAGGHRQHLREILKDLRTDRNTYQVQALCFACHREKTNA